MLDLIALPDVFDARDFLYRPVITELPKRCRPPSWPEPAEQKGNSCVGHAIAALIEIARDRPDHSRFWRTKRRFPTRNRPRAEMILALAERYDERMGTGIGTSLRSALKGWYHHGVALQSWKGSLDLDDVEYRRHCQERPLGAYYRVNPFRLDDLQSAIFETGAVVVTAYVPDSWVETPQKGMPEDLNEWEDAPNFHAFVLIGYDSCGFTILNSYGPTWGAVGTAQLKYADWLKTGVDAWVARPGVPSTPLPDDRLRGGRSTLEGPATAVAPRYSIVARHVIHLRDDGDFVKHGRYVSSSEHLERMIAHALCDDETNRVLIWFHDSLLSQNEQLWASANQADWWRGLGIFPIYFSWPSTFFGRLLEDLGRTIKSQIPPTGVEADMRLQVDQLAEVLARRYLAGVWQELSLTPERDLGKELLKSLDRCLKPLAGKELHLVSAGTGCNYLLSFLSFESPKKASTITMLSPTCRCSEFVRAKDYRTRVFLLRDEAERAAGCRAAGETIHSQSLLTLFSRALAPQSDERRFEVPLLGLERTHGDCQYLPAELIRAPSYRSRAKSPLDFSTDAETLNTIAEAIRGEDLADHERFSEVSSIVYRKSISSARPRTSGQHREDEGRSMSEDDRRPGL